jgi:hypothetical protein
MSGQTSYKIKDRLRDFCLILIRYTDNDMQSMLDCIETLYKFAAEREFPQGKSD